MEFVYVNLESVKKVNSMAASSKSWQREGASRDALMDGVKACNPSPDDILIVTDCDEIPTRKAIKLIRRTPPVSYYKLGGYMYYYSFRWLKQVWDFPFAIRYGSVGDSLNVFRAMRGPHVVHGILVHHCSYCFPKIGEIVLKMQSSAHTEFSEGKWKDPNYIYARIVCGLGIFADHHAHLQLVDFDSENIFVPDLPLFGHLKLKFGFSDVDQLNLSRESVRNWMSKSCYARFGMSMLNSGV
jgi:hypothetical protein